MNNAALVRIQNPKLTDIVNIILTRLAKRQLAGKPMTKSDMNAFQLWWLNKMLADGIVIETDSGGLFVHDEDIAQYGQFEALSPLQELLATKLSACPTCHKKDALVVFRGDLPFLECDYCLTLRDKSGKRFLGDRGPTKEHPNCGCGKLGGGR